jgi:hypothetical protein
MNIIIKFPAVAGKIFGTRSLKMLIIGMELWMQLYRVTMPIEIQWARY